MPFNKKTAKKRENSLPEALGFTDDRADDIAGFVHDVLHEEDGHHNALLKLNKEFDDNELLFAAYVYGRMVEGHCDVQAIEIKGSDIIDALEKTVKEFVKQGK